MKTKSTIMKFALFAVFSILIAGIASALTFSTPSNVLTASNTHATVTLTNNDNITQDVQLTITDIVDGTNSVHLSITPTSITNFAASASKQISIDASNIGNLKFGMHAGTLTAQGAVNNTATSTDKIASTGRIVAVAKGPFGIITLSAILIVGVLTVISSQDETKEVPKVPSQVLSEMSDDNSNKIQVIIVDTKKIPLSEVRVVSGPDCDSDHYHAVNHISVKALDGSIVLDPESCGFGKVKETEIVDIE